MRSVTLFVVLLASAPTWADTVQLSKSTYHNQHVTVEDRDDHYLVHFNVYLKLDEPLDTGGMRFLRASVAFSRDEHFSDVSRQERSVRISQQEETWSFYFRIPKFTTNQGPMLYAAVANVDGLQHEAAAIWKFAGNQLDLGSSNEPLAMQYPVGRTITQDDGRGNFRLVVVYEVKVYENNYDGLPVCGFLGTDKEMPDKVDGERSAKRLQP